MTTSEAALDAVTSVVVATVNPSAVYVPGTGFVIPAIATVPLALLASEQPLGSVMVTVLLDFTPVAPAPQPEKLPPNVTEGELGMPLAKAGSNVTVTVFPWDRAPVEEVVKPTVQVVVLPYTCDPPEKVTEETPPFTVTVGCAEMFVRVPAVVDRSAVVKVATPPVAGTVTPAPPDPWSPY